MESMRTEYARFKQNMSVLQLVRNTPEARKVFCNIMERWTMLRDNGRTDESKVFFLEQVNAKKLLLLSTYGPEALLDKVENVFSATPKLENVTVSAKKRGKVIEFRVGPCQFTLAADRVAAMRDAAATRDKSTDPDVHIAACMLRYKANFANYRQLSVNSDMYSDAYNDGYTIEGMSSAFNSQLMLLAPGKIEFCSLYPDVEAVFGSAGSFFSMDFTGKKCIVHPPRITDIVKETVNYCAEQLVTRPCSFRLFIYDKEELDYVQKAATGYVVKVNEMSTHSENPYTGDSVKTQSMTCYVVDLSSQQ